MKKGTGWFKVIRRCSANLHRDIVKAVGYLDPRLSYHVDADYCARIWEAGWNVTYLGPSLPAEEIASAVFANQFRAVALSIIYPADDPELPRQITRLRQLLPVGMPIIIGGAAAAAYQETIDQIGATTLHDMADLFRILVEVRNPGTTPQPKPEALPTRMLNNGSHNGSEGAPLKSTKRPKGQVV